MQEGTGDEWRGSERNGGEEEEGEEQMRRGNETQEREGPKVGKLA